MKRKITYRHNTIEVFFSKKDADKIPYYRNQPWEPGCKSFPLITVIIKTTKQGRKKRLKKMQKGTQGQNEEWKRRREAKNKDGRKKMRQEGGGEG